MLSRKSLLLAACHCSTCDDTSMCAFFARLPTLREHNNKLSSMPKSSSPPTVCSGKWCYDFPNHHPSVFCNDHINFLPVALCGGGSWSTVARQIGDVPFAIFEVFHPKSHTVGTHTGISIDMTKLIKDICSTTVLLYKESNHSILP